MLLGLFAHYLSLMGCYSVLSMCYWVGWGFWIVVVFFSWVYSYDWASAILVFADAGKRKLPIPFGQVTNNCKVQRTVISFRLRCAAPYRNISIFSTNIIATLSLLIRTIRANEALKEVFYCSLCTFYFK